MGAARGQRWQLVSANVSAANRSSVGVQRQPPRYAEKYWQARPSELAFVDADATQR